MPICIRFQSLVSWGQRVESTLLGHDLQTSRHVSIDLVSIASQPRYITFPYTGLVTMSLSLPSAGQRSGFISTRSSGAER